MVRRQACKGGWVAGRGGPRAGSRRRERTQISVAAGQLEVRVVAEAIDCVLPLEVTDALEAAVPEPKHLLGLAILLTERLAQRLGCVQRERQ